MAKKRRRRGFAALAAIVGLAAWPGCQRATADRGTLTIAVRADVTGFFPNPPFANEGYSFDVNWNVFEGLVRFDSRMRIEPALAERWENPDDRTYVFELRPGLSFSDGRPVTADDVAASLEVAIRRDWVSRDYLQAIERVRALGPRRVEIRTRFPYSILLSKLPWGLVLPAAALASDPVPALGTGPYRLESWTPGREFVLARNRHFRGPAPAFSRARFLVVPEAQERVARLVRGEVDVADQIPLEAIEALRAKRELQVFAGPGSRVLFLNLRMDQPPFSDARVREAVDLAIDRMELIRRALAGRTEAASQIVPPGVAGYNPSLKLTRAEPGRARRLLAAAGYADGLSIRLDGPNNRYVNDRQILEEVARQLGSVGIRVEVNALDKREFYRLAGSGGSRFHLMGWACQTGEAGDVLDALLHSRGGPMGNNNTTGVSDSELDRLIEASNSSLDQPLRIARLQEAMARAGSLRPVIPLLVQTEAVAASRRIRWDPAPSYALRLEQMRPAEQDGPRF